MAVYLVYDLFSGKVWRLVAGKESGELNDSEVSSRIYGLHWKIEEEKKRKRNESEKDSVSGVCMCVRVRIRYR